MSAPRCQAAPYKGTGERHRKTADLPVPLPSSCRLAVLHVHRSSVDTDALCLHECEIIGEGGKFWPSPTFMVTARDREDEPVMAKSCTGCWSQVGRV
jgi:hypothetical protein